MGVGQKKIQFGRKHKFGLNCQAVAIINGKILDISVAYGVLAADFVCRGSGDVVRDNEDNGPQRGIVRIVGGVPDAAANIERVDQWWCKS